jgi:hypothetical protein
VILPGSAAVSAAFCEVAAETAALPGKNVF